jgi:hypothetical protein
MYSLLRSATRSKTGPDSRASRIRRPATDLLRYNPTMADIATKHFDSADEFVKALRRSDPYWLDIDSWQSPWIFRGQREADWKLVPAAWRKGIESDDLYKEIAASNLDATIEDVLDEHFHDSASQDMYRGYARRLVVQTKYEFLAVHAFAELVDDLGLPIPGGRLPRRISYSPTRWMVEDEPFHPTVGLAQHHGMPTRLLDWTHSPLIAAFFAADGVEGDEPGNIIVWAAHRPLLLLNEYREFTVQRSQIGFLHAQEALFTYSPLADHHFLLNGEWPCLEEFVPPNALRRMTLPKSQAPRLRQLLWAERISKAHLMPTLDNVTQALKSLWKQALRPKAAELAASSENGEPPAPAPAA